eukprot:gene27410-4704_t
MVSAHVSNCLASSGLEKYVPAFASMSDDRFCGMLMQEYANYGISDLEDKQKLFRLLKSLNSDIKNAPLKPPQKPSLAAPSPDLLDLDDHDGDLLAHACGPALQLSPMGGDLKVRPTKGPFSRSPKANPEIPPLQSQHPNRQEQVGSSTVLCPGIENPARPYQSPPRAPRPTRARRHATPTKADRKSHTQRHRHGAPYETEIAQGNEDVVDCSMENFPRQAGAGKEEMNQGYEGRGRFSSVAHGKTPPSW